MNVIKLMSHIACASVFAFMTGSACAESVKVTFIGDVMCQGPMLDAYRTEKGWDLGRDMAKTLREFLD